MINDLCEACIFNLDQLCIKPLKEPCPESHKLYFMPLGAQGCYGDHNVISRSCFICTFKSICISATEIMSKAIRSLENQKYKDDQK